MVRAGSSSWASRVTWSRRASGALVIDHRVHVDDGLDVVALLQFPLDVVHYVVDLQQVAAGGHLRVEGHHGPPGAVVMVDQVVDVEDVGVGQDQPVDIGGQRRGPWGGPAEGPGSPWQNPTQSSG